MQEREGGQWVEELGRVMGSEVVSVEADLEINLLASFPLLFSLHPWKAHGFVLLQR